MTLIDLDRLREYPIRLNHYDRKNGDVNFVLGIESVLEYAENLPQMRTLPLGPLLLEDLRRMNGEPVWCCGPDGTGGAWMLAYPDYCANRHDVAFYADYGRKWLAFRWKPECTEKEVL